MTALINEANTAIERAPLRYFAESSAQASPHPQKPTAVQTPAREQESEDLNLPNMARIEFRVRFICGAFFGIIVSLDLALTVFLDASQHLLGIVLGFLALILAFGFAAARYGDKFWCLILRRWWLWP